MVTPVCGTGGGKKARKKLDLFGNEIYTPRPDTQPKQSDMAAPKSSHASPTPDAINPRFPPVAAG